MDSTVTYPSAVAPFILRRGARVAELVDAADSKSAALKSVSVRLRPRAPHPPWLTFAGLRRRSNTLNFTAARCPLSPAGIRWLPDGSGRRYAVLTRRGGAGMHRLQLARHTVLPRYHGTDRFFPCACRPLRPCPSPDPHSAPAPGAPREVDGPVSRCCLLRASAIGLLARGLLVIVGAEGANATEPRESRKRLRLAGRLSVDVKVDPPVDHDAVRSCRCPRSTDAGSGRLGG